MKRSMLPVALAAIVLTSGSAAFAASCSPKVPDTELIKPGTLTMSTNPTLPPLQFVDSSGDLKGMRIEMGTEIAKRLCLDPEYIRIEFSAMIPGLQGRRWDMINTGIFFTEERAKIMQMVPYEEQAISISVAPDSSVKIASKDDLAGKTLGVEIGGFEENKARQLDKELQGAGKAGVTVRTFDNFTLAFQALRAGQVDGVVTIDAVAKEYDTRGDFKRVLSGLYPASVAVAFQSPKLADAVASVMNDMKADGSMKALFDKYGLNVPAAAYAVKGPGR
ncbi:ABC transporter substrate-binding protein [Methylovirgula sp. 4M-Z18]|uniref:ABC transporter substrate-binding protein n=1 Tax=Methylovirgula sp. 4M-Z18 TaxID=2293567 RepID=UPI000E2F78A1|nr:ABC transporter substrate-binding protein [Methylovirgula sp. 4M-Z18]RFB80763.1 ABC transporter substrate-binding protein [Methylovirgula sp. 4M-Z18]